MSKILVFDMDGTIADLYNVPNWRERLDAKDCTVYTESKPMWDMPILAETLSSLQEIGYRIEVVTWLSRSYVEDKTYQQEIRNRKKDWLAEMGFPYDNFHGVRYGTKKSSAITNKNAETAILFDDNAEVRTTWHIGEVVNPQDTDIIDFLLSLLENEVGADG